MTPRPRKETKPPSIESLPESFRRSFIKLLAKENIDVEAAYIRAAILLDINSREYTKAVKKDSQRLYKQNYMRGINAARTTIQRNQDRKLEEKYMEGFDAGYTQAQNDFQVYYYCNICQKRIDIFPNDNQHQEIIKYLRANGWGHSSCHQKRHG